MGELEKYYRDRINYVLTTLINVHNKRMENSRDKNETYTKIYNSATAIHSYLGRKYEPYNYTLNRKIDIAYNENKNGRFAIYDTAIIHYTMGINSEERKKILEKMATIKGYLEFLNFLVRWMGDFQNTKMNNYVAPKVSEASADTTIPEKKLMLFDIFIDETKYKYIMNLLVEKGYCQSETFYWKERKGMNKGFLVAILKDLELKKYYKNDIEFNFEVCKVVAKNTFNINIKSNKTFYTEVVPKQLEFIPFVSQIS
ncbi:MAG: hypothetical protein ACLQQ4_11680 [Bacteroidia bacterium]